MSKLLFPFVNCCGFKKWKSGKIIVFIPFPSCLKIEYLYHCIYAVQWKYWYYQPLMLKRRCKRDPKEQEMSLNGWQNPGCNQGWEGGGEPVNHNLVSIWLKSGRCKKVHKWQCKSALMKDHGFHQSSEGGWWRGGTRGGWGWFHAQSDHKCDSRHPSIFSFNFLFSSYQSFE